MKIILLMICMGSLYNQVRCQDSLEPDFSGKNLTNIPKSESQNITKINLSQNNISLSPEDQESLRSYPNLTELNLCQNKIKELMNNSFSGLSKLEVLLLSKNSITSIGEMALVGLESLKILDLSFNLISRLPENIQMPSLHLQAFYLQNNSLTNLDVKESLKDLKSSLTITLSGNPWDCNCSLISLSVWLNTSMVLLEDENITLCATPKNMTNYTVKAINKAPSDLLSCGGSSDVSTTTSVISFDNVTSLVTTAQNETNATSNKGNSWTFLVGVIVIGIVTSLLILIAVKFPKWYNFILSYNHHRLKEEDPYMFEEEFNVDFNMGNNDKIQDDDNVVVFEQTHSFVPEEDGFIEDKYIDERDIKES
ncbi:hypothetical protein GDO78_006853 [Eleutherodactylus coqui]|uniref:LRRCT domain-containing protein n=1 Tax=Eleutherodactylus coqui TaxID=57060 RepID=A0A8J6FH87_ELECQ|nr:hypothetical protein GDO78_006853 [Eleutherodactylus coqui]